MTADRAQRTHVAETAMMRVLALDRRACGRLGWNPEGANPESGRWEIHAEGEAGAMVQVAEVAEGWRIAN